MNIIDKLETFKLYYSGIAIIEGDQIICKAKNNKDLKHKIGKAITFITGLGLPLKAVVSSENSFIVKSIFQHEPAFKN